jgi:hypothetical protein
MHSSMRTEVDERWCGQAMSFFELLDHFDGVGRCRRILLCWVLNSALLKTKRALSDPGGAFMWDVGTSLDHFVVSQEN